MKIKTFKVFNERVIEPTFKLKTLDILESDKKYSIDDLNILFNENDDDVKVKFMLIDEFKSYLKTDSEIKGLPKRPMTPNVFFGAYLEEIDSLVICLVRNISMFNSIEISMLDNILKHESIHREQIKRSGGKGYSLSRSPEIDPKEYFSHYSELMAFARNFIDQCKENGETNDDILNDLRNGFKKTKSFISKMLKDNKVSEDDMNKFKKYVYEYIIDDINKNF